MVDGGGRCSCQDDLDLEEGGDPPPLACCSAQVFTSVLLGVLACVLMTGGVFLAFHRWDPLWLIVSGIGVLLILIGSILHCCGDSQDNSRARHRGPAGKGSCCGGRPDHMSHGHHLVVNNGSLTEQLLPLSNARSVSQLSLNMLPGYFPPVVTTYGIEQHSAVVQNISRLAHQQQQSPGAQSSAGGKSFILLSLSGNEPAQQAAVQNLVGYTVYQLEESSSIESPAPENTATTPPATSTSVPSSPITPPVHHPLFKSVEVQTCHVWPSSRINPDNSQNASCSNSTTELSPSEIVQNNKTLQRASCSADSACVIQNNCMQKSSSSNSSTELTSSEIVQNNNPLQDASCSSSSTLSAPLDIVHNNCMPKNSSSNSSTELTPSEVMKNNKHMQNASCSVESASSGIRQNNPMHKSSSSYSSTNTPATPGPSQNVLESPTSRMSHNNNALNSSDNSFTESSTSESSPVPKTCSNNFSVDSVVSDPQQPSTSQTDDVVEVANCYTVGIPPSCDNTKSISDGATQSSRTFSDGATQSSRTLEDTPVSEEISSVPVGISGESLLVVAFPEPSTENGNLLELATTATTDILAEVDTTTAIPPVSTTSVDISVISTISSVNSSVSTISSVSPSVSVSPADVPAMSTPSADVSRTSTTYVEVPSTSTSIYDVPRALTISADVPPVSIISADVLPVSLDVLTDISCINPTIRSSDIATSSGDTAASIDSAQQTVSDIGVSRSDMTLGNLSDMDGEVDDSELLDRFSPPPSYDDAIHEGESAIGAFGLAYGTI